MSASTAPSLATLAPLATRGGRSGMSEEGRSLARWDVTSFRLTATGRGCFSQPRLALACPISLRRRTK